MYLEAEDFVPLARILKELETTCQGADGADDDKKGNELFQVFSLKFPMLTLQKNTKELKKEYVRALKIKSAIPHPLIMGTCVNLHTRSTGQLNACSGALRRGTPASPEQRGTICLAPNTQCALETGACLRHSKVC